MTQFAGIVWPNRRLWLAMFCLLLTLSSRASLTKPTNRLRQPWPNGVSETFGWYANGIGLGSYVNRDGMATSYGRDTAGRVISEGNANLETNYFGFNARNQIVSLKNALGKTNGWFYSPYGWLTNKSDNAGNPVFTNSFNANGWPVTSWTPAGHGTGYAYDPVGNLTSIDNSGAAIATPGAAGWLGNQPRPGLTARQSTAKSSRSPDETAE